MNKNEDWQDKQCEERRTEGSKSWLIIGNLVSNAETTKNKIEKWD